RRTCSSSTPTATARSTSRWSTPTRTASPTPWSTATAGSRPPCEPPPPIKEKLTRIEIKPGQLLLDGRSEHGAHRARTRRPTALLALRVHVRLPLGLQRRLLDPQDLLHGRLRARH